MMWHLDGTWVDLDQEQIDVYGGRWRWTGSLTTDGEPVMRDLTRGLATPLELPLSVVYAEYGPLIAAGRPATAAEMRAAIVGDDQEQPALCAEPLMVTAAPARRAVPTPSALAQLLTRLRGRR
ncbi:phiSA1p31-related protein [Streptomyces thermolilacinus]|uniref:phiSA1p31-related protein n=1 Tax=Streptomyces thermolilacinus TaxID=285540 RepID=UPI0033D3FCF4